MNKIFFRCQVFIIVITCNSLAYSVDNNQVLTGLSSQQQEDNIDVLGDFANRYQQLFSLSRLLPLDAYQRAAIGRFDRQNKVNLANRAFGMIPAIYAGTPFWDLRSFPLQWEDHLGEGRYFSAYYDNYNYTDQDTNSLLLLFQGRVKDQVSGELFYKNAYEQISGIRYTLLLLDKQATAEEIVLICDKASNQNDPSFQGRCLPHDIDPLAVGSFLLEFSIAGEHEKFRRWCVRDNRCPVYAIENGYLTEFQ